METGNEASEKNVKQDSDTQAIEYHDPTVDPMTDDDSQSQGAKPDLPVGPSTKPIFADPN